MTFSKIHMLSASAAALAIALAMWVDGIAEPRSAKMKMPPSARALAAAPIALDEEAEPPGRALLGRAHWDAHAAALREMQLTLKSVQLDLAELRRQTIAAQEASSDSATVAQEALGLGKTLAETLSSLTETPQDEQSPADRPEYSRSLPDIDRLAAASVGRTTKYFRISDGVNAHRPTLDRQYNQSPGGWPERRSTCGHSATFSRMPRLALPRRFGARERRGRYKLRARFTASSIRSIPILLQSAGGTGGRLVDGRRYTW